VGDSPATARVSVHVPPPRTAGYDVVIGAGLLHALPRLVAAAAPADRYAVIAPAPVAALYGEAVLDGLRTAGLHADLLSFPDGEQHKTRATWAALTDRMLEIGCGRGSAVIALGGGVAGDLAGFVAATYMRGVAVVQVPTTLLAMIDAAVGGKTAVDTDAGKNLVGVFHPPRVVIMDPVVLGTLPDDAIRAGLAEAVKHGVMLDATYFRWIEDNAEALLRRDTEALEHLVTRSVELKAAVVADDPFDSAGRAVLNFGHTVGHALEHDAGYTLDHGFAVAAGMVVEALAGEQLGVTEQGTAARIRRLLLQLGLPATPDLQRRPDHGAAAADRLVAAMRLDKKSRGRAVHCALPARIGTSARTSAPTGDRGWTHDVPDHVLLYALGRPAGTPEVV
jgi:3-dehydroquinate synthase